MVSAKSKRHEVSGCNSLNCFSPIKAVNVEGNNFLLSCFPFRIPAEASTSPCAVRHKVLHSWIHLGFHPCRRSKSITEKHTAKHKVRIQDFSKEHKSPQNQRFYPGWPHPNLDRTTYSLGNLDTVSVQSSTSGLCCTRGSRLIWTIRVKFFQIGQISNYISVQFGT